MSTTLLIDRTADHVKATLSGEGSGHDWWHVYRVAKFGIEVSEGILQVRDIP